MEKWIILFAMKYALFVVILLTCFTTSAQTQGISKIDSLLGELAITRSDTLKVKLLTSAAVIYQSIDPQKGLELSNRALQIASAFKWDRGVILSENALGINYRSKSQYVAALGCFFRALKLSETIEDVFLQGMVLGNIGLLYINEKDYESALQYEQRAFQIYDSLGNKRAQVSALINIGLIHLRTSRYQEAMAYFNKALEVNKIVNNPFSAALCHGNMGIVWSDQHDYEHAIVCYQQALAIAEQIGCKNLIGGNLGNIGQCNIAIAVDSLVKAGRSADTLQAISSSRIDTGIALLKRAVAIFTETGYLEPLHEFSGYLQRAYRLRGDHTTAAVVAERHKSIRDSIFSDASKVKIAKLETQRERDLKDRQVVLTQREKDGKATERYIFGAILLCVLILIGITLYHYRAQKHLNEHIFQSVARQDSMIRQRTQQLAVSNEKLAATNARLLELIQYNAHEMREPLARVMGAIMAKRIRNNGGV